MKCADCGKIKHLQRLKFGPHKAKHHKIQKNWKEKMFYWMKGGEGDGFPLQFVMFGLALSVLMLLWILRRYAGKFFQHGLATLVVIVGLKSFKMPTNPEGEIGMSLGVMAVAIGVFTTMLFSENIKDQRNKFQSKCRHLFHPLVRVLNRRGRSMSHRLRMPR